MIHSDLECPTRKRHLSAKTGIRLQSFKAVDDIWFTCCALHNYLLEVDGLHQQWTKGIPSEYEKQLGQHDNIDTVRHLHPEIFRRLENPLVYDSTLPVNNYCHGDESDDLSLLDITFESMRSKLVDHFHYRWLQKDIKWPSRNGVVALV